MMEKEREEEERQSADGPRGAQRNRRTHSRKSTTQRGRDRGSAVVRAVVDMRAGCQGVLGP